MNDDLILTEQAKTELEAELKERKTKIAKKIAKDLEESREAGDLSENSWHDAMVEKRDQNNMRIKELEDMLRRTKVVAGQEGSNKVAMSTSFEVEITMPGSPSPVLRTFTMVPATQANPLEGKISIESPLGKILMGHKEGDKVEFEQPDGKKATYSIKNFTE
jgi:transcription elongation factor GreA